MAHLNHLNSRNYSEIPLRLLDNMVVHSETTNAMHMRSNRERRSYHAAAVLPLKGQCILRAQKDWYK